MIDNLKAFLWKVLLPVTLLLGFIYSLLQKNKKLEREVEVASVNQEQAKYEADQKILKDDADSAMDAYKRVRDEYLGKPKLPGSDTGGGQGSSGKTD